MFHHDQVGPQNIYIEEWNKILETSSGRYKEMKTVKLHTWDHSDYATYANGTMTPIGFSKYWEAINDAFQSLDKELMRVQQNLGKTVFQKKSYSYSESRNDHHADKYHWSAPNFDRKYNRFAHASSGRPNSDFSHRRASEDNSRRGSSSLDNRRFKLPKPSTNY